MAELHISERFDLCESTGGAVDYEVIEGFSLKELTGETEPVNFELSEGLSLSESTESTQPVNFQLEEGFSFGEALKERLSSEVEEGFSLNESLEELSPVNSEIEEGFELGESLKEIAPVNLQVIEGLSFGELIRALPEVGFQIIEGFLLGESIKEVSPVNFQITEGFSLGELTKEIPPINFQIAEGFFLDELIKEIPPINLQVIEGFDLSEILKEETSGVPEEFAGIILPISIGDSKLRIPFLRFYEPWPLERTPGKISLSEQVDSIQISLSNIEWKRQLQVLRSKDVSGRIIRIYQGFLDIEKAEADLNSLIQGTIDRISFDGKVITIDLKVNKKYLSQNGLRRSFSVNCPFRFKSRQCGYTGPEESCGKSYEDCSRKGNSKNFGGFATLLKVQGTRKII